MKIMVRSALRRIIAAGGVPAVIIAVFVVVGTGAALAAATTAPATPVAAVKAIENALLRAMRAGHRHAGYEVRYKLIAPVVRRTFDWPFAARTVMGMYWPKLSDGQQRKLTIALRQCTTATYAANFDDYKGETFNIESAGESETAAASPYRVVRSMFTEANGTKHQFAYMLRKQQNGWEVINVIADGVSNLALDRAQFSEIMASDGFDSLLQRIEDKIGRIRATGNGQC